MSDIDSLPHQYTFPCHNSSVHASSLSHVIFPCPITCKIVTLSPITVAQCCEPLVAFSFRGLCVGNDDTSCYLAHLACVWIASSITAVLLEVVSPLPTKPLFCLFASGVFLSSLCPEVLAVSLPSLQHAYVAVPCTPWLCLIPSIPLELHQMVFSNKFSYSCIFPLGVASLSGLLVDVSDTST
jgi:hypothetical protein